MWRPGAAPMHAQGLHVPAQASASQPGTTIAMSSAYLHGILNACQYAPVRVQADKSWARASGASWQSAVAPAREPVRCAPAPPLPPPLTFASPSPLPPPHLWLRSSRHMTAPRGHLTQSTCSAAEVQLGGWVWWVLVQLGRCGGCWCSWAGWRGAGAVGIRQQCLSTYGAQQRCT
jgi:hypothetical protein